MGKNKNKTKGLCRFDTVIENNDFKLVIQKTEESRNYYDYFVVYNSGDLDKFLDLIYSSGYDFIYTSFSDLWSDVVFSKPFTITLVKPLDLNDPNWREDAKSVA